MNRNPHRRPSAASQIRMVKEPSGSATLYVYGDIGGWWPDDVDTQALVREIDALDVSEISVMINSPGGVALDGVAIANALRRHPATVTAHIDGLCASAATIIAVAADEVIAYRGSEWMIHDASGMCWGPAGDMRAAADLLDKVSSDIASLYAEKAGGSPTTWRDAMRAETWYTADEAVAAGLADRVDRSRDVAEAVARHDLTIFAHAGRQAAPAPTSMLIELFDGPTTPPVSEPVAEREGADMALADDIRVRLGITDAEIDHDALLTALDEALAERAEPAASAELPEGIVPIDRATLEALQSDAAAGREARDAQIRAQREALVTAAVTDGRIPPARRDAWLSMLAADPGAAEVLAAMPAGTVPLAEIGHSGEVDADEQLYERVVAATGGSKGDAR